MANIYVRSTNGVSGDGTTWALAKLDLAGAAAIALAGDTIWLSQAHNESTAGAVIATFVGTISSPIRIICGNDAAQPPTSLANTANVSTSGSNAIIMSGFLYVYGVNFLGGTSTSTGSLQLGLNGDEQLYENCTFQLAGSGASAGIRIASGTSTGAVKQTWVNCSLKFSSTGQRLSPGNAQFIWNGGGVLPGSTTPLSLIANSGVRLSVSRFINLDFTNFSNSFNFMDSSAVQVTVTNCLLPTGWSGVLLTGTAYAAVCRTEMYNCDSVDTNYLCWIEEGRGTIRNFSTLYLSGTDGIKLNGVAVPLSYKMSGNANTSYPLGTLEGMWMTLVNETTASQTATLEIIHNESAALNEAEIWLTVDYPATAGSTQFTRLNDAVSSILNTSPPTQTTSTADWDDGLTERGNSTVYAAGNLIKSSGSAGSAFICTAGGTSASSAPAGYTSAADGATITDGTATFKAMRRQKLAVTFIAAEQGIIRARPVLAKTSAVVWVASKISVA